MVTKNGCANILVALPYANFSAAVQKVSRFNACALWLRC